MLAIRVQAMFADPSGNTLGNEIVDRLSLGYSLTDVAAGYREGRDLDQGDDALGQTGVGELMTGPGDADEAGSLDDPVRVVPADNLRQRVRTGDEEPLGGVVRVSTGETVVQVTQGVHGVGGAVSVDIDP